MRHPVLFALLKENHNLTTLQVCTGHLSDAIEVNRLLKHLAIIWPQLVGAWGPKVMEQSRKKYLLSLMLLSTTRH